MVIDRRLLMLSPVAALPLVPAVQTRGSDDRAAARRDAVMLSGFGAALDGATDDSAALQRAVNACLQNVFVRPLIIDGPCRLNRPVLVDRPVDRSRGVFRIIGDGALSGFITAGDFPLFDSNLAHRSAPMSEHVWFQDIRFEALGGAAKATVMSDKFLRVQFHGCEFDRIRVLAATKYAQEWQFSRCIAQRWSGPFFSSHGGYHVVSSGSKYQNGGGHVFEIAEPALRDAGCVGCSFHQDSSESNGGSFLKATIVQGLSIAGLYSEGNARPTLDFESTAPNRGVSVAGCMFAPQDGNKADQAFFDIRWGRIEAGHASGNFASGGLHHYIAANPASLSVSGDYSAGRLMLRE